MNNHILRRVYAPQRLISHHRLVKSQCAEALRGGGWSLFVLFIVIVLLLSGLFG